MNNQWWNRETNIVFEDIKKEVDLKDDHFEISTKSNYEDPKL